MKALLVFAVIVLVCLIVGQLRIGLRARYDAAGLTLFVCAVGLSIQIIPSKHKWTAKNWRFWKEGRPEKTGGVPPQQSTLTEQIGGALDYAQQLLPILVDAAGQFKRRLRVDRLRLELIAGSSDPADAAILYGYANAVLGTFWGALAETFHVQDGDARVRLSFEAEAITILADITMSLKLGQILYLSLYFGRNSLRAVLSVRSQRKQMQNGKAV